MSQTIIIDDDKTVTRLIRLPNGRSVTLGAYVAAWRAVKSLDPSRPCGGFDHFPEPAGDILREMRRGMHDRINRHLSWFGTGRKWEQDYQINTMRRARAVNGRGRVWPDLIHRDYRPRLARRLAPMGGQRVETTGAARSATVEHIELLHVSDALGAAKRPDVLFRKRRQDLPLRSLDRPPRPLVGDRHRADECQHLHCARAAAVADAVHPDRHGASRDSHDLRLR